MLFFYYISGILSIPTKNTKRWMAKKARKKGKRSTSEQARTSSCLLPQVYLVALYILLEKS
jgi:hypothetical protein